MKRFLSLLLALTMGAGIAFSASVDVQTAKKVGQKFANSNFEFGRANAELNLAYTALTAQGEACYYLFNVGNEGFVIVSATDAIQPILAYSYESSVDVDNMAPAMRYLLDTYTAQASYAIENALQASEKVVRQWELVRESGYMNDQKIQKSFILLETHWDQNNPYNSKCPLASVVGETGPGGHAYAGCVACAMAQVMKFWEHPFQGTGSHSYQPSVNDAGHAYPMQSVNFGSTIYDWANMPLSLATNSPAEQIDAVATLMYHCAVSVDMSWGGNEAEGSGSNLYKGANALKTYFGYTSSAEHRQKSSDVSWINLLKEQLDRGWPVPYAGGGHAFVADGYDSDNLIHFNLGWSTSGDGFYSVASLKTSNGYDFTNGQNCIINAVPTMVYDGTPKVPTNFTATPGDNNALTVTLAWKNPTQFLNNTNLSTINQIIIMRDGEIVHTENNVTPGANMTWTDNVPCFTSYDYQVYAEVSGFRGGCASTPVYVGPTCLWTIMINASGMLHGLEDGYISVIDAAGNEYGRYTSSTSSPATLRVDLPLGNIRFVWHKPSTLTVDQLTVLVKNAQNTAVFTHSGSSDNLAENFLNVNNACDASVTPSYPGYLMASANASTVTLNWEGVRDLGYGYNIYKDDQLMALVADNTYTYNESAVGGHCYYVTVLTDGGESAATNVSCVQVDPEGVCCPATDLYYELTSSNKVKLFWTKPVCTNFAGSKCGYYIYKSEEGAEWTSVMKGVNTTNYTDNSAQYGKKYRYKVVAVYNAGTEEVCESMPANIRYTSNTFVLSVDTDGVTESNGENVSIYPNPAKDKLNIKGEEIQSVTMFNVVGQMVYHNENADNSLVIDLGGMPSGIYMVKVNTTDGETVKRVSVVR